MRAFSPRMRRAVVKCASEDMDCASEDEVYAVSRGCAGDGARLGDAEKSVKERERTSEGRSEGVGTGRKASSLRRCEEMGAVTKVWDVEGVLEGGKVGYVECVIHWTGERGEESSGGSADKVDGGRRVRFLLGSA